MSNKLFDTILIATDSKQRTRVRFCNNLAKRLEVLKRDNINVVYSKSFDMQMTEKELLDAIQNIIEDDEQHNAIEDAYERIANRNKKQTSVNDVFNAILSRKQDNTQTNIDVA